MKRCRRRITNASTLENQHAAMRSKICSVCSETNGSHTRSNCSSSATQTCAHHGRPKSRPTIQRPQVSWTETAVRTPRLGSIPSRRGFDTHPSSQILCHHLCGEAFALQRTQRRTCQRQRARPCEGALRPLHRPPHANAGHASLCESIPYGLWAFARAGPRLAVNQKFLFNVGIARYWFLHT